MDAIEAVALALATQMEAQADDTTPSSVQREKGLVWLEGWFDLEAALAAARPFIAAECAKVAEDEGETEHSLAVANSVGSDVSYQKHANGEKVARRIAAAIKETIR